MHWFDGVAQRHQRAFLTGFLVVCIGVAAASTAEAWSGGSNRLRAALVAAWLVGITCAVAHQLLRRRRGRLIVRDPQDRAEARERALAQRNLWLWPVVGGAAAAAAAGGHVVTVLGALFGGLLLGYAPLLLYVALVLRPGATNRSSG